MSKLLLLILCMGVVSAKAQITAPPSAPKGVPPPSSLPVAPQLIIPKALPPAAPQPLTPFYGTGDAPHRNLLLTLPPDGATVNYGFFCRQELKADRALPVSTRFRLGSQQQADALDGKR